MGDRDRIMYTVSEQDTVKTLIDSLKHREQEVSDYQMNIDNYRVAIELAGDDLDEFTANLRNQLASEVAEQKKAQLMLDVALKRLEGEDIEKLLEAAA